MKKLFTKVTAIAMAALMMSPLMAVNVSAREDVPDLINEDEVVAENEAAGGEMPGYNKLRNIIHSQGQRTEITTIYHELDGEFVEHPEYGYTVEKKLDNGATLSLVLTTCGHPDYDNLNVIYTMGSKRVELLTSECSFVYCCYKNFDYNAVYTNGNKKAFVGDVEKYNTFNGNLINWNVKVFNIEKPDDYYGTEITDENFNKETRQMVTEAFTQYIRYCKSAYGLNPADLDFPMYGISYDGHMLTKQWVDDGKYYVGVDGRKVTNAWVDQYNYVGADGKRVSGMVKN